MKSLLNEAIIEMINMGLLSVNKIDKLIYIKEFIERVASKKYLNEEDVESLYNKFGVSPNIVTWGDYFQTELATVLQDMSDSAFNKAIDTVKFDILSSYQIFSSQDTEFFEWVEKTCEEIMSSKEDGFSAEEEEIIHLDILRGYYMDMGIENNFSYEELQWYIGFKEAAAV